MTPSTPSPWSEQAVEALLPYVTPDGYGEGTDAMRRENAAHALNALEPYIPEQGGSESERVAKRQQALEEIAVSDEMDWDAKDCRTFASRVLHDLARQDAAAQQGGSGLDNGQVERLREALEVAVLGLFSLDERRSEECAPDLTAAATPGSVRTDDKVRIIEDGESFREGRFVGIGPDSADPSTQLLFVQIGAGLHAFPLTTTQLVRITPHTTKEGTTDAT